MQNDDNEGNVRSTGVRTPEQARLYHVPQALGDGSQEAEEEDQEFDTCHECMGDLCGRGYTTGCRDRRDAPVIELAPRHIEELEGLRKTAWLSPETYRQVLSLNEENARLRRRLHYFIAELHRKDKV